MWQRALCPTGIYKIECTVFVAHVERSSFHDVSVKACFKSSLLASCLKEVMDLSHRVTGFPYVYCTAFSLPDFPRVVSVDFSENAIRLSILDSYY